MEKTYTVYIHKNKINNKCYIGQTCQNTQRRWRNNGEGYNRSPKFYQAIKKYGWDNFEHIIYKTNLTGEQADELEKLLIQQYDSINNGYNISLGGREGIALTPEQASINNKIKWSQGVYDNLKTAVYCVELDTYYESALEAQRQTGVDNSRIQKVCKGQSNYGGVINGQPLHWLYATDVTEEKISQLKNRKETIKGRGIPLYCPELDETFASAAEAGRKLGIDSSGIRKAATGVFRFYGEHPITHKKLHWNQVN